eukprot:CAMPEP_0206584958 /NCGR_PEP_ID=MMETSP0325_2-20121206/36102_1 /ASSEMBLY_ACC=CAM_ASM_000347 /TAXON_ID=2866 /ORGANISM="Crypthecodinium cohnii, Strain Seligo" /LENGTH=105 /DNA_ID=CAMNT_0054092355 /DNA_START=286 /DNA_END=603 /DNA_ORIENTATION=-
MSGSAERSTDSTVSPSSQHDLSPTIYNSIHDLESCESQKTSKKLDERDEESIAPVITNAAAAVAACCASGWDGFEEWAGVGTVTRDEMGWVGTGSVIRIANVRPH